MAAAFHAAAFGVLGEGDWLHLIIAAVHEDDALSLALTCRALRDALWARFPRRLPGDDHAGRRLRTRHAAATATPARLLWVCALQSMSRPAWVSADGRRFVTMTLTVARWGSLAALRLAMQMTGRTAEDGTWQPRFWSIGSVGPYSPSDPYSPWGDISASVQVGLVRADTWAVIVAAARGGQLATLQWMHRKDLFACLSEKYVRPDGTMGRDQGAMDAVNAVRMAAAEGGHVAVLEWLQVALGCTCASGPGRSCAAAALAGHVRAVLWLVAHGGCGCASAHVYAAAAKGGHVPVLEFLAKWFDYDYVAKTGDVWGVTSIGPDRPAGACLLAARAGHVGVLQWLRANSCPWDRGQCLAASRIHYYRLSALKYSPIHHGFHTATATECSHTECSHTAALERAWHAAFATTNWIHVQLD